MPRSLAGRDVATAILGYGGLLVWLTWPLVGVWETALPLTAKACRFDSQLLGWALAHQSDVLLGSGAAFFDGGAFHPDPRSLLFGEAAFGALPFFFPGYAISGNPTLALNFVFLGGLLFSFVSLHLVVQSLTGSRAAGLVAVSFLVGTRWLLWQWAPCAPNYAWVGWLPWIFLILVRGVSTRARTVGLAVLLAMQGLASIYLAVAAWLVVGVRALVDLARQRTRSEGLRIVAALVLASLPLLAAFLPYVLTRAANPELADQSIWKGTMQLTRFPWGPLDGRLPTGVPLAGLLLVVWGGLAVLRDRIRPAGAEGPVDGIAAGRGTDRAAAWRHALLWIAVGVVASFTPWARLGDEIVRMPHALLADLLDAYSVIRAPHRLGIVALVGLAAAGGLAFARLTERWRDRPVLVGVLAAVLSGLLMAEGARSSGVDRYARPQRLPGAYPVLSVPGGEGVLADALASGSGPLLELPVPRNRRGRTAPEPQVRAMYRAIHHGRPVLNGYSGYWPQGFEARLALARRLPDADALERLVRDTGLRAILVHTQRLAPAARAAWQGASIAGGRLRRMASENGSVLFEVVRLPRDSVR